MVDNRFSLFACLVSLGILLAGAGGWGTELRAQELSSPTAQQAQVDFRGADLSGKDGPYAKVGSRLARVYREYEQYQKSAVAQPFSPSSSLLMVRSGYVVIDAIAARSPQALLADLEALGLQRGATVGNVVSGRLPIEALPEAASLSSLRAARPSVAMTLTGAVTTQGDAAMRADAARGQFGVDGSGMTVGVLSDSYDTNPSASTRAAEDIQSGDLPPASRIAILEEFGDDPSEDSGSDEGRAMMQIIHDVAPGADLAFHTAFNGLANFAQGIQDLANFGSHVIVDDVIFFGEPMFQDGVVAQAVDRVVDTQNVAYFSSAGNSDRASYESPFRNSGQPGVLSPDQAVLHDFGGGDTLQRITIPEDDSIRIAFQWTDPFASVGGSGADTDLDIFIVDQSGEVVARSDFGNIGSDPIEFMEFKNDGSIDADNDGSPDTQFDLGIELFEGPEPQRIKYVHFGSATINEFREATQSPTLFGHANAEGASAVGAVFWFATPAFSDQFSNPFALNSFSSVGGVPIYFDDQGNPLPIPEVRQKPDVVGPDGGNNTFFGQMLNDDDDFPNFFGTSAAAPHVAAVAALMREFDPTRPPAQIYDDLESTAIDMTQVLVNNTAEPIPDGEGFDFYSGFGLVQADEAVPLAAEVVSFEALLAENGSTIRLTWRETPTAAIEEYVVERQYFDGPFEPIATIPADEVNGGDFTNFSFETESLGLGRYTFRLRWRRTDGTTGTSPQQPTVNVDLLSFEASVVGERQDGIQLDWTVPEGTTGFSYTVLARSGERIDTLGTTTDRSFTAENLRPGRYEFWLRMEDQSGNVLNSRTISEIIPLDGAVALGAGYPNPFINRVNIPITTEKEQTVEIRVYNELGQVVQQQFEELKALVPSTLRISATNWASGVYFIQVRGEGFTESQQVVRVR